MTESNEILRFINRALAFGIVMIVLVLFKSESSLDSSNFLTLGGISALGLFAFCRIMERFVHMIDE